MDYRSLVNKLEAIQAGTYIKEATAPTQFVPTHFHKGNLGNKNPVMQTPDGKFYWETIPTNDDGSTIRGSGGKQIAPWQGNTENRSALNPASIDGVITPDGKYIDFPEGVTWKQYKQTADDDAALMAKLKKLMELIEKYNALRAKRGQGARPAGPTTRDMGDGSRLTTDAKGNVAATDTDGNGYIPGSNPNLPQNKVKESINYKSGIAQSLVESFGYEVSEEHTDEGVGALLGRAAPGVGAVLGAQGAYDSYKKGDYLGAALNGLSGAFSLVPGLGWIPALGLGALQAGRELSGATDKYDNPTASGQGGKGDPRRKAGGAISDLQRLQQIIGAKPDGVMGPETKQKLQAWQQKQGITADGVPGPETYKKAGMKESVQMKSLAETMRDLQQKLDNINEADGDTPAADVEPIPPSPEDLKMAELAKQVGGRYGLAPDGTPIIGLPDGKIINATNKQIMVKQGNELVDTGEVLPVTEGLEEGIWDSIAKGAINAFKTGASGAKVATGNLTRAGKSQVVGQGTKIFQKQLATQPALARGAYRAGQGVKAVKNNPLKTAAGLTAAGLAGGYASGKLGSDETDTPPVNPPVNAPVNAPVNPPVNAPVNPPVNPPVPGGGGGNPNPPATPDTSADDAEMAALKAQIEALIKDLSTSKNPEIQKGLAAAQDKLK